VNPGWRDDLSCEQAWRWRDHQRVRLGTTIALGVLLLAILLAAAIQFVSIAVK